MKAKIMTNAASKNFSHFKIYDFLWTNLFTAFSKNQYRDWTTGFQFLAGAMIAIASRPVLGSSLHLIQWVSEAVSPGLKWQRGEADCSSPYRVEIKNAWSYTFIIQTRLHGCSA
jgi:hypothetical protein